MRPDGAALVDALAAANVQFVVVGEISGADPLRVVVSRHPTNLDALGRALDRLGARLQLTVAEEAGEAGEAGEESEVAEDHRPPHTSSGAADAAATDADADGVEGAPVSTVLERVGDPLGTLSVDTAFGGLTLMFGGPSASLYAETLAASQPLPVGERSVAWAVAPADVTPGPRTTGRALGRRLLSLVEGLTHLVEQRSGDSHGAEERLGDGRGTEERLGDD